MRILTTYLPGLVSRTRKPERTAQATRHVFGAQADLSVAYNTCEGLEKAIRTLMTQAHQATRQKSDLTPLYRRLGGKPLAVPHSTLLTETGLEPIGVVMGHLVNLALNLPQSEIPSRLPDRLASRLKGLNLSSLAIAALHLDDEADAVPAELRGLHDAINAVAREVHQLRSPDLTRFIAQLGVTPHQQAVISGYVYDTATVRGQVALITAKLFADAVDDPAVFQPIFLNLNKPTATEAALQLSKRRERKTNRHESELISLFESRGYRLSTFQRNVFARYFGLYGTRVYSTDELVGFYAGQNTGQKNYTRSAVHALAQKILQLLTSEEIPRIPLGNWKHQPNSIEWMADQLRAHGHQIPPKAALTLEMTHGLLNRIRYAHPVPELLALKNKVGLTQPDFSQYTIFEVASLPDINIKPCGLQRASRKAHKRLLALDATDRASQSGQ